MTRLPAQGWAAGGRRGIRMALLWAQKATLEEHGSRQSRPSLEAGTAQSGLCLLETPRGRAGPVLLSHVPWPRQAARAGASVPSVGAASPPSARRLLSCLPGPGPPRDLSSLVPRAAAERAVPGE